MGVRRSPFLGWIALAILVPHSLLAHKEVRFIYPVIPILITLAALGTADLIKDLGHFFKSPTYPKVAVAVALVLFAVSSVLFVPQFTWWVRNSGTMSIVDQLSRDPAVCGLGIHGTSWFNTGGYTHLHRNIPMVLMSEGPWLERESASVNAVIAYGTRPRLTPDFTLKKCSGAVCLYQRTGTCVSPQVHEVNAELRLTGN
jgi:hypothetical protein